jgi:hypothetical protein
VVLFWYLSKRSARTLKGALMSGDRWVWTSNSHSAGISFVGTVAGTKVVATLYKIADLTSGTDMTILPIKIEAAWKDGATNEILLESSSIKYDPKTDTILISGTADPFFATTDTLSATTRTLKRSPIATLLEKGLAYRVTNGPSSTPATSISFAGSVGGTKVKTTVVGSLWTSANITSSEWAWAETDGWVSIADNAAISLDTKTGILKMKIGTELYDLVK